MIDKKYYQEAIDVQNACNGKGVIRSLKEVIEKVKEDNKANPVNLRYPHPVMILYADKMADLCMAREKTTSNLTDDEAINIAEILYIVRDYLLIQPIHGDKYLDTKAFNEHPLIRTLAHLLYKETGASNNKVLMGAYEDCEKVSKGI